MAADRAGGDAHWLDGIGDNDDLVTEIARPESRTQRQNAHRAAQERETALRRAERQRSSLRYVAASLVIARGEVRTRDLTEAGVYRPMLGPMCEEGLLERRGYGLYGPGPKAIAFFEETRRLPIPNVTEAA